MRGRPDDAERGRQDDAERPGPRLERPRAVGEGDEQVRHRRGRRGRGCAPRAPNRTVPPRNMAKPPRRPKTPPIAARTARIVIPVGRTAVPPAAADAGGAQLVGAAGAGPGQPERGCRGRRGRGLRGRRWRRIRGCLIGHLMSASLVRIVVGSVRGPRAEPHPSDRDAPDKPISVRRRPVSARVRPARRSISRASTHRPSRMRWYWRIRPTGRKPTLA